MVVYLRFYSGTVCDSFMSKDIAETRICNSFLSCSGCSVYILFSRRQFFLETRIVGHKSSYVLVFAVVLCVSQRHVYEAFDASVFYAFSISKHFHGFCIVACSSVCAGRSSLLNYPSCCDKGPYITAVWYLLIVARQVYLGKLELSAMIGRVGTCDNQWISHLTLSCFFMTVLPIPFLASLMISALLWFSIPSYYLCSGLRTPIWSLS